MKIEEYRKQTISCLPNPICPSDLWVDRNPFRVGRSDNIDDYKNLIGARMCAVLGGTPCFFSKDEDSEYLSTSTKAGELDAENFYSCHDTLNTEILTNFTLNSFKNDVIKYVKENF